MNYLIVENGIITNIIEAHETFANIIGAKAVYRGAQIGDPYSPPSLDDIKEKMLKVESENKLLKAQVQALSNRNEFMEDCIAEMAIKVYA